MEGNRRQINDVRALARGLPSMAALRLAGQSVKLLTCEGRRPVLTTGGTIRIGRLAVRAITAGVEIGAAPGGTLVIGDHVFVNQGSSIVAHLRVEIGDYVHIGDFVAILDSNFHAVAPGEEVVTEPISIGSGAWIGRNVLILPGSVVGEHAVVGAGSLVNGVIPPATVAAGSPARVLRRFEVPDGWRRA